MIYSHRNLAVKDNPINEAATIQMDTPKVSIIIPTYNYANYLPITIDSALAQEDVSVEIIVVDDGSTDNTRDVCQKYSETIQYYHQENSGPSAARNLGLEHAKAPFTLFLDSDDVLYPNMVTELLKKFDELGEDFAVVACQNEHIDSSGNIQPRKLVVPLKDMEILAQDLLMRNYFNPSSALVRTDILRDIGGFDASLMSSEERDLWLRISLNHRIYQCAIPLLKLRFHSQSYSHNADRMYNSMKTTIGKGILSGRENFTFYHKLRAWSYCEFQAFWMYLGERRLCRAAFHLILSWLFLPWFPNVGSVNYNAFFRLRALRHLLLAPFRGAE